jgi:hypothetical protein
MNGHSSGDAQVRAGQQPGLISGQTHDDCRSLDEEDGEEEVFRDGGVRKRNERAPAFES